MRRTENYMIAIQIAGDFSRPETLLEGDGLHARNHRENLILTEAAAASSQARLSR